MKTVYQADDGKIFSTKQKAKDHEDKLKKENRRRGRVRKTKRS